MKLFESKKTKEVENPEVYIEYLNKEKGHKKDTKYFATYDEAIEWGKENFDRFNRDMIKWVD